MRDYFFFIFFLQLFDFFFQAEDGIRDRSPSRGLGDVYKRQQLYPPDNVAILDCPNALEMR